MKIPHICPSCIVPSPLAQQGGQLSCSSCNQAWPIVDGIPQFSPDIYWGEIPEAQLRNFIDDIKTNGMVAATEKFRAIDPRRYDFMFDPSRADWRFGIDIKPTDHVLDAGCGIGAHTFALCDLVDHVTAFDSSKTRVEFVKSRVEHEGKKNIDLFVGDFMNLPLPENSFDVIVFNGLLEWVGVSKKFDDPYKVQQWVAEKCYKLLKPGGRWYIGIENRWALAYFAGGIDHSYMAFTSLMPRWLANAYCKLRKGHDYRTYTHGKRGYEKLIKNAGFEQVDFMLVYPGYNNPRVLIPFDSPDSLRQTVHTIMGNTGWKRKLVKSLINIPGIAELYRYLFYSYAIYAIKKPDYDTSS